MERSPGIMNESLVQGSFLAGIRQFQAVGAPGTGG